MAKQLMWARAAGATTRLGNGSWRELRRWGQIGGLATMVISLPACGGGEDSGDAATARGRYVVSATVYTPDTATPVIHVVDSLEQVGKVSPSGALETTQTGVVAVPGERAFIGVGFDDPSVTRFDLDERGIPVETARLSAANYGVTYLYRPTVVSRDEVWFLSTGSGFKIFRIDIRSLEILGVLDFPELGDERFPSASFASAHLRGDTLFATVNYEDWEAGVLKPGVTLLALNLQTLTSQITRDERCSLGFLASVDGELLVAASHPVAAGYRLLGAPGVGEPCVLRIRPGEATFDPAWVRYYSDWTNGRRGGGMFPVGPGAAYVRVLDETRGPAAPTQATEWAYANAWSWARIDPMSDAPAVFVDDVASHGPVDAHQVGDEIWSFDNDNDTGVSQLRRLDADGFTRGASFDGYVYGILRLDQ